MLRASVAIPMTPMTALRVKLAVAEKHVGKRPGKWFAHYAEFPERFAGDSPRQCTGVSRIGARLTPESVAQTHKPRHRPVHTMER